MILNNQNMGLIKIIVFPFDLLYLNFLPPYNFFLHLYLAWSLYVPCSHLNTAPSPHDQFGICICYFACFVNQVLICCQLLKCCFCIHYYPLLEPLSNTGNYTFPWRSQCLSKTCRDSLPVTTTGIWILWTVLVTICYSVILSTYDCFVIFVL